MRLAEYYGKHTTDFLLPFEIQIRWEPFEGIVVLLFKKHRINMGRKQPMDDPAEKFLRFAAECELMAKFTRSRENRTVWTRMAERWLQCAQLYDRRNAMAHAAARRHRAPAHSPAH
jgi:hypothetical protein